jgi:hypothetical protein
LDGGPPCFQRDSACPAVLSVTVPSQFCVAYGTLTRSGRPFQQRSATTTGFLLGDGPATPSHWPSTPHKHRRQPVPLVRFGLLPVRSPLLRECSLFLEVLRCFSSPGSLLRAYVFSSGYPGTTLDGLPHSDTLGSSPARGSPRHFAAWPRPSSAPDAKASTVCPSRESACRHQLTRTSTAQQFTPCRVHTNTHPLYMPCRVAPVHSVPNPTAACLPDTSQFPAHCNHHDAATAQMRVPYIFFLRVLRAPSVVKVTGGAAGTRTPDLRLAKAALSRLSYSPVVIAASGRSWT